MSLRGEGPGSRDGALRSVGRWGTYRRRIDAQVSVCVREVFINSDRNLSENV